jgi:hypothetical protein
MLKASRASFFGQRSHILSTLVDYVSQLSHVFYEVAAKHPITNIIDGKVELSSAEVVCSDVNCHCAAQKIY